MTSIISNEGKKIVLNRTYKATPDYTVSSKFKVGTNQSTPVVTNTALTVEIPILDGTANDDGSNTYTGSGGGDNSTNNTTTYKTGAGTSDTTSQNLIANNTSATKTWTNASLDSDPTAANFFGFWFYILDATALAKFLNASTCLEVRFRTNGDGATLYYSKTFEKTDVAVGWNWLTGGKTAISSLTQGGGGAASGVLDEFVIIITTNNSTDTFIAGAVLFDLLRDWEETDLLKTFETGYPSINETTFKVTTRCILTSTQANGFLVGSIGLQNTDGTPKVSDIDSFTEDSKSDTDEFVFDIVNGF